MKVEIDMEYIKELIKHEPKNEEDVYFANIKIDGSLYNVGIVADVDSAQEFGQTQYRIMGGATEYYDEKEEDFIFVELDNEEHRNAEEFINKTVKEIKI